VKEMQSGATFRELFQQYQQEEPSFVPLTNDLLFHKVFTGNQEALAWLLSSLLNLPREEITDIEILNPIDFGDQTDSRQTIVDLKVRLNRGSYILVEIQVRRFPFWTNRTLVYASKQIADQVSGQNFKYDQIQQVIQISIMNYSLFPDHRQFFGRYSLKDDSGYEYTDRLQFLVMDLTARELATERDKKQGLVEWGKAFSATTWEEVERVQAPGIQEVKKAMTFIMSQPTERERVFARQMAVWDMNTLLQDAERRGADQERVKAEEAVQQEKKKAEEAVQQEKKKAEKAVLQEKKKAEEAVQQEKKKAEDQQKMIVQRMHERGAVPEEIAAIMNQDLNTVKQWLLEKS